MIEPFLRSQLEPVARRGRLWRLSRDLTVCWAAAAAAAFLFYLIYRLTGWSSPWVLPLIGIGTFCGAVAVWLRSRRGAPDFRQLARQIEERHPELHALLLTAVEQQPDAVTGSFTFLQQRLLREAILESMQKDWMDTVSRGRLLGIHLAQVAAFVLLLIGLTGLRTQSGEGPLLATGSVQVKVTPGDVTIERGKGLAVLARFEGALPPDVTLVLRPDAEAERRIPLVKSLNDPVFGGTIPEITNTLSYHVVFGDGRSRDFQVNVFEFPRLERADAQLVFPAYTELPEKRIEDTRRLSAVQGSLLNLSLQLNKPVASARLIARDKSVVSLLAPTNRANASLSEFPLNSSQIYELVLVDQAGRTNKVPAQFVVEVLTNRAPELKFTFPRGDQRVSPLQEISFQGEAWDDFGLKGYGITYSLAGAQPQSLSLGTTAPAREKRQFDYLLSVEDLAAEPDQLLSYYLWADDIGPDGKLRRNASDMYYAEIRPFEEIFREAQARPESESEGEQSGEGAEMVKLAELQKQIINATWRLQRDNQAGLSATGEASGKPSGQKPALPPNYAKDLAVVLQSQEGAIEQVQEKKQQSQNAETKALWDTVERQMIQAAEQLSKASRTPEPLPSALASEQSAYQALLRLASRERQVAQGRNSRGSGSGQQNQRQLDQLELKQTENKYENQRQAGAQQNPEQREQLQISNRLKELAQRQQDLNERLKELQTALQEAKTDQEKEEIRRRLKRLREEEQQMLADVDELLQRMERPENQSRMAEERRQLEQTRNQVQRASEMIEKESVSQALSSGTRAQRELQDLRDDMRKKNSAQFSEEMREMRSDARDLAQNQERIGEQLQNLAENRRRTLSDSSETKQLLQQLDQQTEKMTNLLEQMTRVSQEAEASEPLLSKQLYDTLRKASQGDANDSLQKASELLNLSFVNEAGQFEERARKEIDALKQGVERAAESVLGDEREALRMARRELDDLSRQLEDEFKRADQAERQASSQPRQSQPGDENGERGQASDPSAERRGERQDGEPQRSGQVAQAGLSPGERDPQSQRATGAGGQNGQAPNDPSSDSPEGTPTGQQLSQTEANEEQQGSGGSSAGGGTSQQAQSDAEQPNRPRQRASLSSQTDSPQEGQTPGGARGARNQAGGGGGGGDGGDWRDRSPITGEGYADWSDRLRDVEEMLDLPELRAEVARARERARALRTEFKRLSKPPRWDVVRSQIAEPLADVRSRIGEELARRESKDSLVPIDRDPVPQKFSELVRRYYETLGGSEPAPPQN